MLFLLNMLHVTISRSRIFLVILLVLTYGFGQSQNVNIDDLWTNAKYYTTQEIDYTKAEELVQTALKQQPNNFDFKMLLAKIYWRSDRLSMAENEYANILEQQSNNYDAFIQIINLYESQNKFSDAYKWINKALEGFPNDENLLFRKTYNLQQQGYEKLALHQANALLQINPDHKKAKYIYRELSPKLAKNFVLASYSNYYSMSTETMSLKFYNMQYGRNIGSSTLIGMITRLNTTAGDAMQYSGELYSKLSPTMSSYLHMSFSNSERFPNLRLNGELFKGFKKGYEASFRLNMMVFDDFKINVWSPSIGKYYKNLYITFTGNYIQKETDSEMTYNLKLRRYFENPKNYVGLSLGSIPSDDIIGYRADTNLSATFISFEGKYNVALMTSIGASYLKNIGKDASSRDLISLFLKQDF